MKIKEWNYKGYGPSYYGKQKDWNQTIVTSINYLADMKPCNVIVPVKFKPIFESLEYFDKKENLLLEKYKIEFVDTKHSIIYVNLNAKLEIINFD